MVEERRFLPWRSFIGEIWSATESRDSTRWRTGVLGGTIAACTDVVVVDNVSAGAI